MFCYDIKEVQSCPYACADEPKQHKALRFCSNTL